MSNKHRFTIVSPDVPPVKRRIVDWTLCYICQEDYNSSNIVFPYKFPGFEENPENSSYYSTAQKLKDFQDIDELPPFLRLHVEHYESANRLALDFIQNKAVFLKNCVSNYNKQKYNRKLKQKRVSTTVEAEAPETPRTSRRTVCTETYSKRCFFCDQVELVSAFHSC